MIRGSGRTIAPKTFSRLEHQLAYSVGNNSLPSAENQADESWIGSVPGRKNSVIVRELDGDGNNPVVAQISRVAISSLGGERGWSFRNNSCIIAAQRGDALCTARVLRIGCPSEFPIQTATVCSLLNPTVQASRKPLLVPVFAAIRSSKAKGELRPKLFWRASLSHRISVIISVAAAEATRPMGKYWEANNFGLIANPSRARPA